MSLGRFGFAARVRAHLNVSSAALAQMTDEQLRAMDTEAKRTRWWRQGMTPLELVQRSQHRARARQTHPHKR